MIDVNITLLIQLANFIIALVGMNYLLIAPVRKIIKQRRDLASGMLRDTEQFTQNASGKLKSYEDALARAREDAASRREAEKTAALAREAFILENAQREAREYLAESRAATSAQIDSAISEIRSSIPALADTAAKALLGQKITKKPGR